MHKKSSGKSSEKSGAAQALTLSATVKRYSQVSGRRELLGFADLVIGGAFVIKGLQIVRVKEEGSETYGEAFVSFPSKKGTGENADKFYETSHPISAEARKEATAVVLKAYEEASEKATA